VHDGKALAFIELHHVKSGTFCSFLNSYHHFLLQRLGSYTLNTKSPLKHVTALSTLKHYCWNSEIFRFSLLDSFSFQKNNYLDNMSCWYAIQSWLRESLGELHVNTPTLVGPMETSRLQTSLVWNWKTKLGRQNSKLVLIDRVHNIAVMPTAKYSILFRTGPLESKLAYKCTLDAV
jgi:hypothetical protein